VQDRDPKVPTIPKASGGKAVKKCNFQCGGEEIKRVKTFKYLGRMVSEDDDDTPAIDANIKKAKAKWAMSKKLLTRKRCSRRVMDIFTKRPSNRSHFMVLKPG
jgi:hypothetical protein